MATFALTYAPESTGTATVVEEFRSFRAATDALEGRVRRNGKLPGFYLSTASEYASATSKLAGKVTGVYEVRRTG